MTDPACAAVILAAGLGTRMRAPLPKALQTVGGLPMLKHVQASVSSLAPALEIVVVGPDMPALRQATAPAVCVEQSERRGTADAVKSAREALADFQTGCVFILFGDSPFLPSAALREMAEAQAAGAAVVVLGFDARDPTNYGRLVLDKTGALDRIVEERDATADEKAITLCNSGVMAVDAAHLFPLVDQVRNDNAKGEYYLTDLVALARQAGLDCRAILADEADLMGVDSKADLAVAEARFQDGRRAAALAAGVTLRDPATVWFSWDTALAPGCEIGRNVVLGPGVSVEEGAVVRDFCHLEGATVRAGAAVGPFARLRPETEIGPGARIGNFVEVKNALFGEGAKANHLSYIGDASVGAGANVGAGTITCNYDGVNKARTEIGDSAFIGSNSALIAPISIGAGAIVGAGSTLSKDVKPDALVSTRAPVWDTDGGAARFREKATQKKAASTGQKGKRD
ncbi:MAG: bifunctional UDP-N-acetylglucosamine diphosphorylase/glucosamine-1-phosphate N-acetyltransferase GlmU [Alphaproteobacteria bacterium]|nr:bifunctional UDP-N-acetylglucosamine diphosphorylase/glucosamine-1-phosphate N-acetyltransferase GlmU [Alphaproteobacteria bacterium]